MREVVLVVGVVLLAACSGERQDSDTSKAQSEEKVLNVYNWVDYVGDSTIADFEARTGITVNYDVYDSSEVLDTKLLTGRSGYDIVVPSGARAEPLISAGAFRELDKSILRNLGNLDPQFMRTLAKYDPGNRFGLPYLWGTIGIGYNPDRVEKILGTRTIDSLSAVFEPTIAARLAKCGITLLNSPESMFSLALIYLGFDSNSQDRDELAAAETLLIQARPYVRYFDSAQYVNDLASGEVCVSVGWSYGIAQARLRGGQAKNATEVIYVIPKEGAPIFVDLMGIPIDAPHPNNAHAFLDYLMEPKVIAEVTNAVRSPNGNAASLPFVTEALRADPAVYPDEAVYDRLRPERYWPQETVREVTRAWTRIRTGQ
jgi:putrescine transport system substrate-binding protein